MDKLRRSRSLAVIVLLLVTGCSDVLDRRLAEKAFLNQSLPSLVRTPELYRGDLFLLGGRIVSAHATAKGTLVDALYMRVNKRGFLSGSADVQEPYRLEVAAGRGFPEAREFIPGEYVSVIGRYLGTTAAGAGDARTVPVFQVQDIHLWGRRFTEAFGPPPGVRTEEKPAEPMPYWQDPLVP